MEKCVQLNFRIKLTKTLVIVYGEIAVVVTHVGVRFLLRIDGILAVLKQTAIYHAEFCD